MRMTEMTRTSHLGLGSDDLLIGDADALQGACAHELLAVHRVDGPAWVPRLPPTCHRPGLQLPHLLALGGRLLCHQGGLHGRLQAILGLLLQQTWSQMQQTTSLSIGQ